MFFFFNDTATTEIYTLSLHDALPICHELQVRQPPARRLDRAHVRLHDRRAVRRRVERAAHVLADALAHDGYGRSEEHTSELQSRQYLVCRLLLEKKKKTNQILLILTI